MSRLNLPLNGLRAFDAAARHLSFTRAADELGVTQAAVSHQVKALEDRLGRRLFTRLPRGLALTDEGLALLPPVVESFERLDSAFGRIREGRAVQVVNVGVVSAFAAGWLVERLDRLAADLPQIDVRLFTHNNRVDLAADGLDCAIRFGDGAWHGTHAAMLLEAPLSPVCTPAMASTMTSPADLLRQRLIRSYRNEEWSRWFAAVGIEAPALRGPVFDSSLAMVAAAEQGVGVALAPPVMFSKLLETGSLVQPFPAAVDMGAYWLTWLKSRHENQAVRIFHAWLTERGADRP